MTTLAWFSVVFLVASVAAIGARLVADLVQRLSGRTEAS